MDRSMKRIKNFPIFFLFLCLQILLITSNIYGREDKLTVDLASFVEPNKVPLNQTVVYTIQIKWIGNLSQIEIENVEEPAFSNFDILGTASSNQVSGTVDGKIAIKEFRYTLQPKTLGMGYIEQSHLTYKNLSDETSYDLYTQRIPVEVLSAVAMPGETQFHGLIILMIIIVLSGASIGFIIYKKRTNKEEDDSIEQIPLEDRMLAELKETIDLKNADRNESIRLLSKLFKTYLAEKFNISALEVTTQDLMGSLKNLELEESLIIKSESLFQKADLIKFSGKTGTQAELDEAYITIETVLETQQNKNK